MAPRWRPARRERLNQTRWPEPGLSRHRQCKSLTRDARRECRNKPERLGGHSDVGVEIVPCRRSLSPRLHRRQTTVGAESTYQSPITLDASSTEPTEAIVKPFEHKPFVVSVDLSVQVGRYKYADDEHVGKPWRNRLAFCRIAPSARGCPELCNDLRKA